MSSQWNNGLPFLPGNTFRDLTKTAFHLPQTLDYKNGCPIPLCPSVGIGKDPLLSEELLQQEINELSFEGLNMTWPKHGPNEKTVHKEFIPAYVALENKVLCFHAYFMENILFTAVEENRIRYVVIYYYLVDDSMCITEPVVENSGLMQGTRVKRHRLPKNERGEYFHWKDLNLGFDLEVYGVKYHITQCDAFTEEFMKKQGIVLNDPEPMPEDLYSKSCTKPTTLHHSDFTPSNLDKKDTFFTMNGQVLRFFAVWENSDCVSVSLDCRTGRSETTVDIYYYLMDDTVEVREVKKENSGRSNPLKMRRQRIPKKLKSESFPSCVMDLSKEDVVEYLSPKDFQLGQPIKIHGFSFLLFNCDNFTKEYYQKNYPDMNLKLLKTVEMIPKKEVVPSTGSGSLQNWQNPKPHKEDDTIVLRYTAKLDSPYPEDEGQLFILSYFPFDGKISISRQRKKNSGFGTRFLQKTRVAKPGSSEENPEFYSPADFAIGATVEVFSHRFVLIDVEPYTLKYLESISSQIPSHTLDSLRQKLGVEITKNLQDQQDGGEKESP